jgi:hypothetical protein
VGPLLAGPLQATNGVEGANRVALVFGAIAQAGTVRIETVSRGGVESLRRAYTSLSVGWQAVRESGPVTGIFLLVVAHCSLTMSFDAMLPGMADHHMDSPTNGFTILTVAVGAGAFIGTFVLAFMGDGRRGPLFLGTAVLSGLTPVALAASDTVPPGAAAAFSMGASQAMFMALAAVFLQELVDDAVRGRVMSLYLMSAGGIMAIANLGFGSLADMLGVPVLLLVPGLVFVAIVALSIFTGRYLRQLYTRGRIEQPAGAASPAG